MGNLQLALDRIEEAKLKNSTSIKLNHLQLTDDELRVIKGHKGVRPLNLLYPKRYG